MADKQIRLNHIFSSDNKTVIIALDHGIAGISPLAHLEHPRRLIPEVQKTGADAIITTSGIAQHCSDLFGRVGLILRIDGGPSALSGDWNKMEVIKTIDGALRLGADAVIMMGITGTPDEATSLAQMGRVAEECERWGMPLIAEMLPGGFSAVDVTMGHLQVSARLAVELGADIVKISYKGPADGFEEVTSACYKPLVVLGGSKQPLDQLVREISDAQSAGACGVAVGRNVWQAENVKQVITRLIEVIHKKL